MLRHHPPGRRIRVRVKTSQRILIGILVLVVAGALSFLAVRTLTRRDRPSALPPSAERGPGAVIKSPELQHIENGKLAWKVLLDRLELQTGGGNVAVQGLREGLIYDGNGKPALRITAKQVRGDTQRRDFEVIGQVVVTSPKGFVIRTERATWRNDVQKIDCPGAVSMKAKNIVIATTGLVYTLQADQVACPNQVRMYSGNNRVVGHSLVYDVKTGNVELQDIQMVINPEEGRQILKEWSNP